MAMETSMHRMAGGLGNFLLSLLLLCFSGIGAVHPGRATNPKSVETLQLGPEGSLLHATASVQHVGKGKRWTLQLEVQPLRQHSADESE